MLVTYLRREEMPDKQFFECTRYLSTLHTDACAKMWRESNHLGVDRHFRCKSCPVGALHAGETAANMSPIMGTLTCARCQEGSMRLIGHHLCVSCYNRQREWILQRNAKGKPPTRLMPLAPRVLSYMTGREPKVMRMEHSNSILELMYAALRDSRNTVRFAFRGDFKGPITQLRLF